MRSEAYKIARLQCETQLCSQALGIVTDPLWSTILGFAAVHEMRKRELVGPVADDILYAGIIAVNTARTPGLAELAGRGIDAAGMIGAGATGLVAGKIFSGRAATAAAAAGGAGAGSKAGLVAAASRVAVPVALTAAGVVAGNKLVEALLPAKDKALWRKVPMWKRAMAFGPAGPLAIADFLKKRSKKSGLE
jgi:hypothetical protein